MLENIFIGLSGALCGYGVGYAVMYIIEFFKRKAKPKDRSDVVDLSLPILGSETNHNATPRIRLGIIEAMNGKILEVSVSKLNLGHGHYDWSTELYVIPEGQKVSEAVSTVMLMKGLAL